LIVLPPSEEPSADPGPLVNRIADRASRLWHVDLSADQLAKLEAYLVLLARWNRTINLTALVLEGFPDPTLDRLLGEPLVAAQSVSDMAGVWFDLGSGGGTPALPFKIARPSLALTMVESRSRKAAFLGEAVRALRLENARVLTARFEGLGGATAGTADLVTVRALRVDEVLQRVCAALLKDGSRLLLFTTAAAASMPPGEGFRERSVTDLPGTDAVLRDWERRST
jgi:16S rRNA (guanine527-N7)-methyltransferase